MHRSDAGVRALSHEGQKVEMFFAHLKLTLKLDRLRLGGISGATDEITLSTASAEPTTH